MKCIIHVSNREGPVTLLNLQSCPAWGDYDLIDLLERGPTSSLVFLFPLVEWCNGEIDPLEIWECPVCRVFRCCCVYVFFFFLFYNSYMFVLV